MIFDSIKPYLRFVRFLTLTPSSSHCSTTTPNSYIAYDARMFFVIAGNGVIRADGIPYEMKKNSLIIINSGVPYYFEPSKNTVSYIAINFDFTFTNEIKMPIPPDIINEYDSKKLIHHVTFSDITELNKVFYIHEIPSIEKKLLSIEKEYTKKINMYELRISSYMTDILIKCIRHIALPTQDANDPELVNKIINYIQENSARFLTNQQIADLFHYHPNYISALVKRYTGVPLHQYITNLRVSKAADLLLDSTRSVHDIATSCGFYDSSHLIRCFKERMGMTPLQYQNMYQ